MNRVLLLSPYSGALSATIRGAGDQVMIASPETDPLNWPLVDFVVLFGWKNIIKEPWLNKYKGRMINIHGSYLPWNRGAYPNLFSWVYRTKKGASIHYVDEKIDMGNIIVRQEVDFKDAPHTTLESSYNAIKIECERLFERAWPTIRKGDVGGMKQEPNLGSFHTKAEALPIIEALPNGWATPVSRIECRSA